MKTGDEKDVLQELPTFKITACKNCGKVPTFPGTGTCTFDEDGSVKCCSDCTYYPEVHGEKQ